MRAARIVAGHALAEALRRKVFLVVLVLSLAFGGLYAWGVSEVFEDVDGFSAEATLLDAESLAGATLLGLAMFGTLFLGTLLAVFLTIGAVRGDAERGLLQPVLVRPVRRADYLLGRFAAAALVASSYAALTWLGAVLITGLISGWWPDRVLLPALELAAAVALLALVSLLGSVVLGATANGIAVLMLYGAGLLAGLLGQIGEALDASKLTTIADTASWALPFEALYRDALGQLVAEQGGLTDAVIQLGPLGASHGAGAFLLPWTLLYAAGVAALTLWLFTRRDL